MPAGQVTMLLGRNGAGKVDDAAHDHGPVGDLAGRAVRFKGQAIGGPGVN